MCVCERVANGTYISENGCSSARQRILVQSNGVNGNALLLQRQRTHNSPPFMRTRSLEATVIPSCCLPCGVCVQIIRGGYSVLFIPLGINAAAASRLTNFTFSTRGSFYHHLKINFLRHYQIVHMCYDQVFLILLNKSIVGALY